MSASPIPSARSFPIPPKRPAAAVGVNVKRGGTYLCMEGPAFSTKAESNIYRSWNMDVIGMTNLQEAKLAREAEICYVTIAMVTDYDCWHEEHDAVQVTDIIRVLQQNAANACQVIAHAVKTMPAERTCKCGSALQHALITDKSAGAPDHYSEAGTDCRQVFRVAKRWRPSGAASGLPAEVVRSLGEEQPAEFFRVIVESLADSFDPAEAAAYEELMRAWIPPRAAIYSRSIPDRVETVYVLSRVTLGADIKITSIILDAMKKRFPSARNRVRRPIENRQSSSRPMRASAHLECRVSAGGAGKPAHRIRARASPPAGRAGDRIVVDPDSRMTQLGLIPVCEAA